jgi:copper chaperone
MRHTILIENLKCGGCTSTILSRIGALDEVRAIVVDQTTDTVTFEAPAEQFATVRETLIKLGYPERGSAAGLAAAAAKARSYVSCVIGKMEVA